MHYHPHYHHSRYSFDVRLPGLEVKVISPVTGVMISDFSRVKMFVPMLPLMLTKNSCKCFLTIKISNILEFHS